MRIILLALFLTSCVTYPKYVKKYECTRDQKYRLPEVILDCLESTHKQKQKTRETIDQCHSVALKAVCTPRDYFVRVALPTFQETTEIRCSKAQSFIENYICDYGE